MSVDPIRHMTEAALADRLERLLADMERAARSQDLAALTRADAALRRTAAALAAAAPRTAEAVAAATRALNGAFERVLDMAAQLEGARHSQARHHAGELAYLRVEQHRGPRR